MTTVAVLTPLVDLAPTVTLGRTLYRKQILPRGTITYNGKPLTFDESRLNALVDSFKGHAYDAVPFVLADPNTNAHNMGIENVRGQVKGLEITKDGLDALVELPAEWADRHVGQFRDLGVSARIVYDLDRADGKKFPAAIQHVLATLDPRVTGMRPWEKVSDLANDTTPVVDLSGGVYDSLIDLADTPAVPGPTGPHQPTQPTPTPEPAPEIDPAPATDPTEDHMATLSDDVMTKLAAFASKLDPEGNLPVSDVAPDAPIENVTADDLTDEEYASLLEGIEALEPADAEPEMASAGLSEDQQAAVDLANATASEYQQRLAVVEGQLASARWREERARLVNAGVPPAQVDLAAPLLKNTSPVVVDLSNGAGTNVVDASATVRKMLDAMKGTVDLSGEIGSGLAIEADTEADNLLATWGTRYPN